MGKNKIEQVVILAGGLGTRLRPVTYKIPKVLVEVKGKPFLHYQFEYFKQYGFKRFLILVSYLGKQIEQRFGDGRQLGIDIKYSYETEPMGTGGALKLAEANLDPFFVLANGDTFIPFLDYTELINCFDAVIDGLIVVYDNREGIVPNNILVDEDGFIIDYAKQRSQNMNGVDAGVSIWAKKMLQLIPPYAKISLENDIFPVLIRQKRLKAFLISQKFYDMGTFEGLKIAENILR